MIPLTITTIVLLIISFIVDRQKTIKGSLKGLKQFLKILPTLLSVIIIVSIVLFFVSDEILIEYLGEEAGIGAFSTAKIPMILFEIGFLGLKFSLLRILITIPVFILIGIIMGKYFVRNKLTINEV